MTTTEALGMANAATAATIFVVADVLTFRAVSVDDVVAMLRAATSCEGAGPSFVLDGCITILIDADGLTVLGVGV